MMMMMAALTKGYQVDPEWDNSVQGRLLLRHSCLLLNLLLLMMMMMMSMMMRVMMMMMILKKMARWIKNRRMNAWVLVVETQIFWLMQISSVKYIWWDLEPTSIKLSVKVSTCCWIKIWFSLWWNVKTWLSDNSTNQTLCTSLAQKLWKRTNDLIKPFCDSGNSTSLDQHQPYWKLLTTTFGRCLTVRGCVGQL